MFRYFTRLEVLLSTGLLFLIFWLFSQIPLSNFGWLSPMSEALSDFSYTDLVFSKFRKEQAPDTNIVIVNIGRLPRNEVASVLRRVCSAGPKVVGIDALFRNPKEPAIDTPFVNALKESKGKVVLVHELYDADVSGGKLVFKSVRTSHPMFNQWVRNGYANITNSDGSPKTIRSISPQQKVGDTTYYAFPVLLAKIYNPKAVEACLARGNEQEEINWRGNLGNFYYLDHNYVLDESHDLSLLRGKIVLMALAEANENNRTFEDMYFTPINEQYAGKSFPDMYGIVIHANMISMILNGNYLETMPTWLGVLIAVVLCYLNMTFFTYIHFEHGSWFDVLVFVSQIIFNLIFLGLAIYIFDRFRYEIEITTTLAVFLLGPSILEIFLPAWELVQEKYSHKLSNFLAIFKAKS